MLKGIDTNQRIEFSYSKDTEEPRTIFVLRPLSGAEMLEFTGTTAEIVKMVELSLVEVKNYPTGGTPAEILKTLELGVLGELIKKVNEICRLSEQDAKNS